VRSEEARRRLSKVDSQGLRGKLWAFDLQRLTFECSRAIPRRPAEPEPGDDGRTAFFNILRHALLGTETVHLRPWSCRLRKGQRKWAGRNCAVGAEFCATGRKAGDAPMPGIRFSYEVVRGPFRGQECRLMAQSQHYPQLVEVKFRDGTILPLALSWLCPKVPRGTSPRSALRNAPASATLTLF